MANTAEATPLHGDPLQHVLRFLDPRSLCAVCQVGVLNEVVDLHTIAKSLHVCSVSAHLRISAITSYDRKNHACRFLGVGWLQV